MSRVIIVIGAEGQNLGQARSFVQKMRDANPDAAVLIFDRIAAYVGQCDRAQRVAKKYLDHIIENYRVEEMEILAFGGFGAAVAFDLLSAGAEVIDRVFFIGGAPASALSFKSKLLMHTRRGWLYPQLNNIAELHSRGEIDFDLRVDTSIVSSSVDFMVSNPQIYAKQLAIVRRFMPYLDIKNISTYKDSYVESYLEYNGVKCGYIPNSDRPIIRRFDPYLGGPASAAWANYGIHTLEIPDSRSSQYMVFNTVEELSRVIERARNFL